MPDLGQRSNIDQTIASLLALAADLWVQKYGAPRPEVGYSTAGNEFLWAAESAYFDRLGR